MRWAYGQPRRVPPGLRMPDAPHLLRTWRRVGPGRRGDALAQRLRLRANAEKGRDLLRGDGARVVVLPAPVVAVGGVRYPVAVDMAGLQRHVAVAADRGRQHAVAARRLA